MPRAGYSPSEEAGVGAGGAFPPWEGQKACADVSGRVTSAAPATFGIFESGAALDMEIVNNRSSATAIPAARDIIARGETGRQYAPSDSLASAGKRTPDLPPVSRLRYARAEEPPDGSIRRRTRRG